MVARQVAVTTFATGEADPSTARRTNFGPFFWELQLAASRSDLREGGRFADVDALAIVPEREANRLLVEDIAIVGAEEFRVGFIGSPQASGFCEVALKKAVPA